ncbi:multicopper oxidase family protein [Micromonospora sp. SL1-18]|uniref:multicopper oxidase family protein n=1 Tax=Micromonospora sp. SL1-18 TaxID=3399128 RepID=UPI003A4DF45D
MPLAQLAAVDLLAAALAAAAWLGAGVAAAVHQSRLAVGLFGAALLATVARVGSVVALAGGGWWFVQERVILALPVLGVAALVAVVLAGPRLVRAVLPDGRQAAEGAPRVVVPLLAAGYAALAGLLVTFLVGYPVGWAESLLTVAVVGAAVLVTWRLAVPRRSVPRLVAGAVALATGLAGAGLAVLADTPVDTGGGAPVAYPAVEGRPVTSLRQASDAAPGGTVRRYTLTARKATVTLASGRRVDAWTFDGQVPGPPITATEGDLIEVTLRNADIERGVTLHWHGYEVPSGDDGAAGLTQEAVSPGHEFVYRFPANQAGTYWYHTHQVSDVGVRKGLYGTLVVQPRGSTPSGLDLTLPVHTFGDTAVIGDQDQAVEHRAAPGTPVRLRLINTDSKPRRITLSGTPYRLVAVDGRNLNEPGPLGEHTLVLAAGGRYDLAFPMPAGPAALLVDSAAAGGLRLVPEGLSGSGATVPDTASWPELDLTRYGAPAPTPFDENSHFDRRFTMVLDRSVALPGGVPKYAQTVNGRAYPSIPTQVVREGDLVLMTIVNRGQAIHPWHLHGHTVLVLSRDGRAPSGSPLYVDSFDVRPGEVWLVGFRATNPGLWMNHCHDLSHFAQGMSLHLAYEGVSQPFHGGHDH